MLCPVGLKPHCDQVVSCDLTSPLSITPHAAYTAPAISLTSATMVGMIVPGISREREPIKFDLDTIKNTIESQTTMLILFGVIKQIN